MDRPDCPGPLTITGRPRGRPGHPLPTLRGPPQRRRQRHPRYKVMLTEDPSAPCRTRHDRPVAELVEARTSHVATVNLACRGHGVVGDRLRRHDRPGGAEGPKLPPTAPSSPGRRHREHRHGVTYSVRVDAGRRHHDRARLALTSRGPAHLHVTARRGRKCRRRRRGRVFDPTPRGGGHQAPGDASYPASTAVHLTWSGHRERRRRRSYAVSVDGKAAAAAASVARPTSPHRGRHTIAVKAVTCGPGGPERRGRYGRLDRAGQAGRAGADHRRHRLRWTFAATRAPRWC